MRNRLWSRSWRGAVAALAVAGLTLPACGGEDVTEKAYFIQPEIFTNFVALIGATSALVAQHSVQTGEVDLANLRPSCGVDDPGAISAVRACDYDAGATLCQTVEDFNDCTFAAGEILVDADLPGDGSADIVMTNTGFVNGNLDASVPSTEVAYDGAITIGVGADSLRFREGQGIVATEPNGTITDIDAKSDFVIEIGADSLTYNGQVTYDVVQRNVDTSRPASNLGTVSATLTGFVLPLSAATCNGPTAGTIDISIPLFNETARAVISGCNQMALQNLEAGEIAKSTNFTTAEVEAIFSDTLPLIRIIAAAPGSLEPIADAPFDAAQAVTALAPADTWCRLFTSTDDEPVVSRIDRAPSADAVPVAECLSFSPATNSVANADTDRALTASMFALEGTGGTSADIDILGSLNGAHGYDDSDASLQTAMLYEVDVTSAASQAIDTLADFENGAVTALFATTTTGVAANPFAEDANDVGGGTIVPDMRCIADPSGGENPFAAPEDQCDPAAMVNAVDLDFSPVGMWLLDASTGEGLGLYVRVIEE